MTTRRATSLGFRLGRSFVVVALMCVFAFGALAVSLGGADINEMLRQQRADVTRSLLAGVAGAYNTGKPGWSDVDLEPALSFASSRNAAVTVLDGSGHTIGSTMTGAAAQSLASRSPIYVNRHRVGTLIVSFRHEEGTLRGQWLRSSLTKVVIESAAAAILLALIVAVLVVGRLMRPINRISAVIRARSRGDRNIRIGQLRTAPRELADLAAAFDQTADTIELQERDRRDLASDLAHELRTPIAILQANCEAMLDGVVPQTREQTASLYEEVLHLAELIEDLDTLAGPEAPALHLRTTLCDFAALVNAAADAMAPRFAAAGLTITRQIHPAVIRGDPIRLRQVVTNVLSNAQKFTPPGGHVTITLRTQESWALLTIQDTGIGMNVDDQRYAFERSWRAVSAQKTPGSGIGLAVVAKVVKAHCGDVVLNSRPGEGTSVVISLPAARFD